MAVAGIHRAKRIHRFERLESRNLLAIVVDTLTDEFDGSIDDGDVSLRDAIAAAPAGEVIFIDAEGTLQLSMGQLSIDKPLRIIGPGADRLTIDANSQSRIFGVHYADVSEDRRFELSGVKLTGGMIDGAFGGAIWATEDMLVSQVHVAENPTHSIDSRGDVEIFDAVIADHVSLTGGNVSITNSRVEGSRFFTSYRTNTTITDSTFVNAGVHATLPAEGDEIGELRVVGSTFNGADSASSGIETRVVDAYVYDSLFEAYLSSAIEAEHSRLEVVNSEFQQNHAAIETNGGALILNRVEVTENHSTAPRVSPVTVWQASEVTIQDSEFRGNSSSSGPAAVAIDAEGAISVADSVFKDNHGRQGGALCIEESATTVNLDRISIVGNSSKGNAGGLLVRTRGRRDDYVSIIDSQIENNSAESIGGGMQIDSGHSRLEITNTRIVGNSAGGSGGGMYLTTYDGLISNSTISDNSSQELGGGIYRNPGTLKIEWSDLSYNEASSGGGLYSQGSHMAVANSSIVYNLAHEEGGGIHGVTAMENSTVAYNAAILGGGLVRAAAIRQSTISHNQADIASGIYSTGRPLVVNSIVSSNAGGHDVEAEGLDLHFSLIENYSVAGDVHGEGNVLGVSARLGELERYVRGVGDDLTRREAYIVRLAAFSPAIDAGDNAAAPKMDITNNDRIQQDVVDMGAYEMTALEIRYGDFDDDGAHTCEDLNALELRGATGDYSSFYDLNFDGELSRNDIEEWLRIAGMTMYGQGLLPGDANLDGVVDTSDFNIWNQSKFTQTAGWCNGDFNGDGSVDVSDFNIFNENKFSSVAFVPELTETRQPDSHRRDAWFAIYEHEPDDLELRAD